MNKQYLIDLIFKTQVGSMSVSKASQLIHEEFDILESKNKKLREALEYMVNIEENQDSYNGIDPYAHLVACVELTVNKAKQTLEETK